MQKKAEVIGKIVAADIDRVWARHRACQDPALAEVADRIATAIGPRRDDGLPDVVEYTCRSGDVAFHVAQQDRPVAVISTDAAGVAWLRRCPKKHEATQRRITLFEEPLALDQGGIFMSPCGGWKVIILRDVLPRFNKDGCLTDLLLSAKETLTSGGVVIVQTYQYGNGGTVNDDLDGVVLTEVLRKARPRVYDRVFTARTENEGFRLEEQLLAWDASDLHACARDAGMRSVSDLGLDPTRFCCYVRAKDV